MCDYELRGPSGPTYVTGTLTVSGDTRLIPDDPTHDNGPAITERLRRGMQIPAGVFHVNEIRWPNDGDTVAAPALPSSEDLERWLRDVPNAVLDLLPPSDAVKNARAAAHECARMAHEARERA